LQFLLIREDEISIGLGIIKNDPGVISAVFDVFLRWS